MAALSLSPGRFDAIQRGGKPFRARSAATEVVQRLTGARCADDETRRFPAETRATPEPQALLDPLSTAFCGMRFSDLDASSLFRLLEQCRADKSFGYVVTPNVDHVVRNARDAGELRRIYAEADLSLCDSHVLAAIARLRGLRLPVIPGSDLMAVLFEYIIDPTEPVTIIGGMEDAVASLIGRYRLQNVRHHNPPMGFIKDREAVSRAVDFVESHPSRYVLFCVGSPQQEMLADAIRRRGRARGMGLCVGASLLFLTGELRRAPCWMQRAGLEWMHRLAAEPTRLWRRYLVDGPQVLGIAARDAVQQRRHSAPPVLVSIVIPTFRREHLLPRALRRCCGQSGIDPRALEILVVDNSADASARPLVEAIAAGAAARIRYLHEPRPGIFHARNRGVGEAVGEYVAFIDDDEEPSPTWLSSLLRAQRLYRADVVLGPVHPVFEVEPSRLPNVYRAMFTQASDTPTGTPVAPHVPFAFGRRDRCRRPLATNNALVRRECFQGDQPFAPELGLTGGEDTLFFNLLQRSGRRIVYCREAVVHEHVPETRLRPGFVLRRKFRNGQITSSTCVRLDPPAYNRLLGWMSVGAAQAALGAVIAAGMLPFNRETSFKGLCMSAGGLGKLLFLRAMRERQYGAGRMRRGNG